MGPYYEKELDRVNRMMTQGFNHRYEMHFNIDYNVAFRQIVKRLKSDVCDLGVEIVVSRINKGTIVVKNVPQPARDFILTYLPGTLFDEWNV